METIGDRIRIIRKEELHKTQKEFGDCIGLKPNSVSDIESGKNKPTQQTIMTICREFGYNEEWIRNGTPPKKNLDKISAYLGQIDKGNDEFIKDLIVAYMELDPDSKKALQVLTEKMYQNRKERGQ